VSIGERTRQIRIEQRTGVKDAFGQAIDSWVPVATTWARIRTLSGGEALRAQAMVSEASVELEIRYRAGVTAAMRAVYGSRIFNIGFVNDVDARHETMLLVCSEGLNQGG
jgi:SPP1 family predicted phage head-tail adaptor